MSPKKRRLRLEGSARAKLYRIHLYDEWSGPIYEMNHNQARVNKNYFKIPLGQLKPNSNYRLQVEALMTIKAKIIVAEVIR